MLSKDWHWCPRRLQPRPQGKHEGPLGKDGEATALCSCLARWRMLSMDCPTALLTVFVRADLSCYSTFVTFIEMHIREQLYCSLR